MDAPTLPGIPPLKPRTPDEPRLKLRPYQRACIYGGDARGPGVLRCLRQHQSTLVIMATGLGKSAVICELARIGKGPVLVVVDGDVLVDNIVGKLEEFTDSPVDVEQGMSKAFSSRIVVGSLDSCVKEDRLRRLREYGFTLMVIDEAHQAASDAYQTIIDALGVKYVGLTATPDRPDKKALPFQSKAYEYQLNPAINDGWLCKPEFRNPKVKAVDFSGVNIRQGDLSLSEARAIMGSEEALHGIVGSTIEMVGNRQTIMMANSIHNARAMADLFNRYKGKGCAYYVDTKDRRTKNERRAVLAGYKRGDYQYICQVNILNVGFDSPETAALGMAAPTLSAVKYFQALGRGLRGGRLCPVPGKTNCLVLDYVGNAGRHPLITPAYILAGKFGNKVQRIAARIQREEPERDAEEIVRMSREEYEAQLIAEADRRKFIVAKVLFETETIDPFKIIKAQRPNPFQYDNSGPISTVQFQRMEKWKMDIPPNCTKRMAQKLIKKEHDRLVKGYASYRMCKWGLRRGYDLRKVQRERAHALFDAVKANGWKSIPRAQAAAILLNADIGESG